MKLVILFACLLAVVAAGSYYDDDYDYGYGRRYYPKRYVGYSEHYGYSKHYPGYYPRYRYSKHYGYSRHYDDYGYRH